MKLVLLRQAILAFAGAVSKVLDGFFHAQRYIGELIEVIGQVAGEALLLRAARRELFIAGLHTGCGANAIDGGAHLARAAFIFGLGMLGMVAADVVTYPKCVVACRGKLPQGVVAQWLAVGSQCDGGTGCKERAVEHQMVDMDESFFLRTWPWAAAWES